MKIVVNTLPLLSPLTGVGYYTYQILRNLSRMSQPHEYTYFHGYYSKQLMPAEKKRKIFYILKEGIRKTPILGSVARDLKGILRHFSNREFDLSFEPNYIPLDIPAQFLVVTVLDFSFTRFPQWHTRDKVQYYQKHFWEKIKKAHRIICISDFIRNEAVSLFGFLPEKLTTIHLGVDHDVFKPYPSRDLEPIRAQYNLPENFILFVGSIEPRKNLKGLLKAYQDLDGNIRKDIKLVLVGFKGWENREIMELIREMEGDVFYIGYVPEEDLAKIYNLAHLMAYPSFYEGFGLPPLEAMACGCPVVVSKAASLPEVCGDAAYYVDPEEVTSIAGGISKVLSDEELRASQIKKGIAHADGFRWEKSALQHLHIFEEVFRDG